MFSYPKDIKTDEFSGYFYPSNREELNSMVDGFLKEAQIEPIDNEILGIISPHAGYIYSGKVAGYSYKILSAKQFDTVILLGPSHRYYFEGISIYPEGVFRTPLGDLEIDNKTTKEFSSLNFVNFNKSFFDGEHCLEVQLPFIIKTLNNVKIVPILFGRVFREDLEKLADKLVEISNSKKILIVVSTDLSHYLTYDEANKFDGETIEFIKNKDENSILTPIKEKDLRACGLFPVITLIKYCKKKNADIKVLKYLNSGDTSSNKNRVVGYLSAVMYKKIE